jgi:hypothetical protein
MSNIKLDYPMIIRYAEDQFHAPDGGEVFMDEFGVEWIKFRPNNGYQRGSEHMIRTDQVALVRDEPRRSRA